PGTIHEEVCLNPYSVIDSLRSKAARSLSAPHLGPDIGTTFSVKAATPQAAARTLPALTLTRGARHLTFVHGGRALVLLRGEIQHKDLWLIDLETGADQQLTKLPPDFDVRDFDISPDGREVVLERLQERSKVVLLDLSGRYSGCHQVPSARSRVE